MRPHGSARLALLAVIQSGGSGAYHELARQAQVPEHQARHTLCNLRRFGVIDSIRPPDQPGQRPQSVRVIYTLAANDAQAQPFDALTFMRQVWR